MDLSWTIGPLRSVGRESARSAHPNQSGSRGSKPRCAEIPHVGLYVGHFCAVAPHAEQGIVTVLFGRLADIGLRFDTYSHTRNPSSGNLRPPSLGQFADFYVLNHDCGHVGLVIRGLWFVVRCSWVVVRGSLFVGCWEHKVLK